ncbi:MAG: class I SAM-dependent methyltransferase, partial [Chloroflexi bacterium]|nr:class I SAM-dependent methyltransferase [Chloroflexota bacterium]
HPASEFLELRPGQRCLDVGCGIGEDARAIAEAFGAQVIGIDNNPRMIEVAQSRSAAFPHVTFETAEASKLRFAKFDVRSGMDKADTDAHCEPPCPWSARSYAS